MDITFLGTASGTEPMANRRYTSVLLSTGGWHYFLDAGEFCSHTAHILGANLLRIAAVFISHPHIDHIGGLVNLVWTARKLYWVEGRHGRTPEWTGPVPVYLSSPEVWQGLLALSTHAYDRAMRFEHRLLHEGEIYRDERIAVSAQRSRHLETDADGRWLAYSYVVESEGKRLVYSGDLRHVTEIDNLVDGADLVLMETGHHGVAATCQHLAAQPGFTGRVGLYHHGREILDDPEGSAQRAHAALGDRVFIAQEAQVVTL